MACRVCARSTRRAASLPGEGSTHLRGCGMTAVGTNPKCRNVRYTPLLGDKRTSRGRPNLVENDPNPTFLVSRGCTLQ